MKDKGNKIKERQYDKTFTQDLKESSFPALEESH